MTKRKSAAPRDPSLPPLFTGEEWCEIVDRLTLSPRQAQVLGLVLQSHKDKEIATTLDISHATVRTHLGEAKSRMLADDRVGLAYRAFLDVSTLDRTTPLSVDTKRGAAKWLLRKAATNELPT